MKLMINMSPIIIIFLYFMYSIYASPKLKNFVSLIFLQGFSMLFDFAEWLKLVTRVCVVLSHFLGRMCVVAIFVISVIALTNEISIVFGYEIFSKSDQIAKIISLIEEKKLPWIAATAIIAATVALGHFRTLDLAIEKYQEEQKEKLEIKIKKLKSILK